MLAVVVLLSFIPDDLHALLELRHEPITQGQWWRLYTCQFVHLSFNHTLLNLAGYSIVAFSFRDEISPLRELVILFISATAVGMGIYTLNPEIYSYVGLSGAIYGVLVAYALIGFNQTPLIAGGFLAFIAAKFTYEAWIGGANPDTEAFIGGKVATDSHLYGAIAGIFPGLFYFWRDAASKRFLDTNRFVNQFQEGIVRDLAWTLHSPPLIAMKTTDFDTVTRHECARIAWDFCDRLQALDQHPQPLMDAVKPETLRLGLYFESLLAYWFTHQDRYQLLQHGLQVQHGSRTVGEFDFIVYDSHTGLTEHWEAAVKFYLGIRHYDDPSLWYGPAKKDRFDIKLNHLSKQQITLSAHPDGERTLRNHQLTVNRRRLFVKGRLFYPSHARHQPGSLRQLLCPDHLKGYWYRTSEILAMQSPKALGFYPWQLPEFIIADKEEWLTLKQKPIMNFENLRHCLEKTPPTRPVTVVATLNQKEVRRFFAVPDDWTESMPEGQR